MGDVNLFAGLSDPSPDPDSQPFPALAPRTSSSEKPWPLVKDGGYCEPYGPVEVGQHPAGRWVRCREPGGCEERAVPTCLRCGEHLRPGDLLDYADSYAVASILYYGGAPAEFMRDAQFDGLCSALLGARAWHVVPWLEEGMLKAGSGYDLKRFPPELHEAAREWKESEG